MRRGLVVVVLFVLLCGPFSASAADRPKELSSLSAVLYEPTSGTVLYAKDADTKRPMASTTKLMTALVASEMLEADANVTIPEAAVLVEGSAMGLRGGDVLSVRDLLAGALLSSGNDAANALALLTCGSVPAFAVRMNAKAAQLGMSRSVFVTPSGLDEGDHGATAHDLAVLGAEVLKQPLLAELCAAKQVVVHVNNSPVTLSNHNRLLWLYEDAVGLKTGFTKKSGKCLVSAAERDGVTLVVATLNGGDYWNDHMVLYEYGFSQVKAESLPPPALPTVSVCGGEAAELMLAAEQTDKVVLLNGERKQVATEWVLPRFVWAPVQAGECVGTLRYTVNGRVLAEVPLTAAENVTERRAWRFAEKWQQQIQRLLQVMI